MSLEELRKDVDEIDGRLISLLNERARTALLIGKSKVSDGSQVQDAQRERAVTERAQKLNEGPLSNSAVLSIYNAIISACTEVQEQLKDQD